MEYEHFYDCEISSYINLLQIYKVSGTTDEDLRRYIKEMDDNSNKIALPLFDLTFQMFPFLRFLPFSITRKSFLVKQSIDRMMDSIKKLTVSIYMKYNLQYQYCFKWEVLKRIKYEEANLFSHFFFSSIFFFFYNL